MSRVFVEMWFGISSYSNKIVLGNCEEQCNIIYHKPCCEYQIVGDQYAWLLFISLFQPCSNLQMQKNQWIWHQMINQWLHSGHKIACKKRNDVWLTMNNHFWSWMSRFTPFLFTSDAFSLKRSILSSETFIWCIQDISTWSHKCRNPPCLMNDY